MLTSSRPSISLPKPPCRRAEDKACYIGTYDPKRHIYQHGDTHPAGSVSGDPYPVGYFLTLCNFLGVFWARRSDSGTSTNLFTLRRKSRTTEISFKLKLKNGVSCKLSLPPCWVTWSQHFRPWRYTMRFFICLLTSPRHIMMNSGLATWRMWRYSCRKVKHKMPCGTFGRQ